MKYPDMDFGRMEAVINKLGGMDGVERFLRGDLLLTYPDLAKNFKFLTKMWVGAWKTMKELQEHIRFYPGNITPAAHAFMEQPSIGMHRGQIQLELITVTKVELGLKPDATLAEVFRSARRHGLDFCIPEMGPHLFHQHIAVPGTKLVIGFDLGTIHEKGLFTLDYNTTDFRKLDFENGQDHCRQYSDVQFVFVRTIYHSGE